jgi:hypothetical protein
MRRLMCCLTSVMVVVMLLGLSGVVAHAGGLVDTTFDSATFPTPPAINDIDNPYWTLPASTTFVYYTMPKVGDEGCEINYVWVKDQTVTIAGVETREVQDWVYVDEDCDGVADFLSENTLDWYAQDNFDNVWYLGEYTEEYLCTPHTDPGCTSTEGTWTAGVDDAEPGIVMLAEPTPGDFYQQEYLEDEAEDVAKVLRVNARVVLTFDNPLALVQEEQDEHEDCVKTKEWSPLEIGVVEHKYYCDSLLLLVNELQGGTVRTELVAVYYLTDPEDVGVTPPPITPPSP